MNAKDNSDKDYELRVGNYGLRLSIKTEWKDEYLDIVQSQGVVELALNYALGWKRGDLGFLRDLKQLKVLHICDYNIQDISEIHHLTNLRCLEIDTYCKTEIVFSKFPYLEECYLEWRPKAKSVFDCTTLRNLKINRFSVKDSTLLSKLVNLEHLLLYTCPMEDLGGLAALKKLTVLDLALFRKLVSLQGLESLVQLKELSINSSRKVRDISPLGNLVNLEKLNLCNGGEIETLAPLESLHKLRKFFFYETTNILDGDMSVLLRLPKLEDMSYMNRKHYSHTREEIAAMIAQRHKLNGTN